jgi:hypothetical protein
MVTSRMDVTIDYPDGIPTFWDFLCGKVRRVVVRARTIQIPRELLGGNYAEDGALRAAYSTWVAELWQEKDAQLEALHAERAAAPNTAAK